MYEYQKTFNIINPPCHSLGRVAVDHIAEIQPFCLQFLFKHGQTCACIHALQKKYSKPQSHFVELPPCPELSSKCHCPIATL